MTKIHLLKMTGKIPGYLLFAIFFASVSSQYVHAQYAAIGADPLEWLVEPHSSYSKEIYMSVETPAVEGPLEYNFICMNGGGESSGWQNSNEYHLLGLEPDTEFTYMAKVRNANSGEEAAPSTIAIDVKTRSIKNRDRIRYMAEIDRAIEKGEIELIPIRVTGDKDNRINFCVINRWVEGSNNTPYNSPELKEEFLEDVRHAFRSMEPGDKYAIAPFPEYRNFFNLYAIWWPGMPAYDWKDGMSTADLDEIRDRLFLPWNKEGKGWVSALAMVNSNGGGGGAARTIETRTGNAMIAGRETEAFIHEFAHTAPGITDEYTSNGVWGRGGEGANTEYDYMLDQVDWRAWIQPGTEVPTPYSTENLDKVGLFEGATHRVHHLYRPTARGCIMGAGSFTGDPDGLCPICWQRAISRFYMWVNPFDSIYPARTNLSIDNPSTLHFAVDVVEAESSSQKLSWYLNGRLISQGTDEMDISFGDLDKYELECKLVDETEFVRPDMPFSDYPRASVKWVITNNSGTASKDGIMVDYDVVKPVEGLDNGRIKLHVTGGKAPYLYKWDDDVHTAQRKGLEAGNYRVVITDADYRKLEKEIVLDAIEDFKPWISSRQHRGMWEISVEGIDKRKTDVYWTDGVESADRKKLPDGAYACRIVSPEGNEVFLDVKLKAIERPFEASVHHIIPSTGNMNNGKVSFNIEGGRQPYTIEWSDGYVSDDASRNFIIPGEYSVKVKDANQSVVNFKVDVDREKRFYAENIQFVNSGKGSVKIANPDPEYRYLWYKENIPDYVPIYPNGKYFGTCVSADGKTYKAEASVMENRGGVFIRDTAKNDNGSWILLKIYTKGEKQMPLEFDIETTREEGVADIITIDHESKNIIQDNLFLFKNEEADISWDGTIEAGTMKINEEGLLDSEIKLYYSSRYNGATEPVAEGIEFTPPEPGNYYVALKDASSGALSLNRAGISITREDAREPLNPLSPSKVKSANMVMWMDGTDLNADGEPDGRLFRRGSANGGKSKVGDVGFHWFNYFPNAQNGNPVLSWRTLWIQSFTKPVNNYQTVIMVRRESDLSGEGSAPWRDINKLIGTGKYGENLFQSEISEHTLNGTVRVNSKVVDPKTCKMPEDFYVVTYVFDKQLDMPFKTTDGQWEGDIGEVLVFDSEISEKELQGVEDYLYKKWISGVSY